MAVVMAGLCMWDGVAAGLSSHRPAAENYILNTCPARALMAGRDGFPALVRLPAVVVLPGWDLDDGGWRRIF